MFDWLLKSISGERTAQVYNEDDPVDLLVIGAALPRTGTGSLSAALEQLYKRRCYHMTTVTAGNQEDIDIWTGAFDTGNKPSVWKEFFEKNKYVAGVDSPFCWFYEDLMKVYPNAKVILTTRDPVSWYKSVKNTIFQYYLIQQKIPFTWMYALMDRRKEGGAAFFNRCHRHVPSGGDVGMMEAVKSGQEAAVKFFHDWETEVIKNVPADRLLVYKASDGWGPLCQFLGVAEPSGPYPRKNETNAMIESVDGFKRMTYLIFYVLPVLIAVFVYFCLMIFWYIM